MKRLFIFISTILLSLYMVMNLVDKQEEILFGDYPTVDVLGTAVDQPVASRETVTETLTKLAKEQNSLIARRIVEPNEAGETRFSYATYGEGELATGLTISSKESAETSDLSGSYLIVSGNLNGDMLQKALQQLGYNGFVSNKTNLIAILIAIISSSTGILSLVIFLL